LVAALVEDLEVSGFGDMGRQGRSQCELPLGLRWSAPVGRGCCGVSGFSDMGQQGRQRILSCDLGDF